MVCKVKQREVTIYRDENTLCVSPMPAVIRTIQANPLVAVQTASELKLIRARTPLFKSYGSDGVFFSPALEPAVVKLLERADYQIRLRHSKHVEESHSSLLVLV